MNVHLKTDRDTKCQFNLVHGRSQMPN